MVELDSQLLLGEILCGMEELNMGRAVGVDGLPAEIFRYGGTNLSQLTHDLIVKICIDGEVPKIGKMQQ